MTIVLVGALADGYGQNNTVDHSSRRLIVKFKERDKVPFGRQNAADLLDALALGIDDGKIFEVKELGPENTGKKRLDAHRIPLTYLLQFNTDQEIDKLIAHYEQSGIFEYVEPDFVGHAASFMQLGFQPNDPFYSRQWYLGNDGSFDLAPAREGADINMELAWDVEQGDKNVIVAILDTGVKLDHTEFQGRIWVNKLEMPNGVDDDRNGFIDDGQGWNFVDDNNLLHDQSGHGTHVTGVLAASGNNGTGYAGVDWNCSLMICKVLDNDLSGFYSWWINAIYFAVDNGADVINMSLGGEAYSRSLEEAVNYAHDNGVVVVASAQNFNADQTFYPAGYSNTIAVGATDPDDSRSTAFLGSSSAGSNYGQHIDVVAPGNYIFGLSHVSNANYDVLLGGTSQSAPMVSGLMALLKAQDPGRSAEDLANIVFSTSDDRVGNPEEDIPGWDAFYGFGRINAFKALNASTDATLADSVNIYPNPASGELHVAYRFSRVKTLSISLINLKGQTVSTLLPESRKRASVQRFDVSQVSPGQYVLMFRTGKGILTRKLILAR